jgi:hypothetical protein
MSLKIFHVCFIIISALLCGGVAWWCFDNDVAGSWFALFVAGAVSLPVYGAWFLWRTRKLVL